MMPSQKTIKDVGRCSQRPAAAAVKDAKAVVAEAVALPPHPCPSQMHALSSGDMACHLTLD